MVLPQLQISHILAWAKLKTTFALCFEHSLNIIGCFWNWKMLSLLYIIANCAVHASFYLNYSNCDRIKNISFNFKQDGGWARHSSAFTETPTCIDSSSHPHRRRGCQMGELTAWFNIRRQVSSPLPPTFHV